VLLWIVGFALSNVPFYALAALPSSVLPGAELQLWRFVTAPLAYPSTFSAILSLLLSGLFFGLSGPQLERQLGRARFLAVLAIAAVVSSAASLLAGQPAYGLTGPLFGLFGALLVLVWSDQRIRVQILVMIGLNLLLSLAFGGFGLAALVGGLLAGAGTMYVLHSAADHPRWRPHTPALWIGAPTAVLVLLAIARGVSA
jgi:membrane associated rhomboid family serine protease